MPTKFNPLQIVSAPVVARLVGVSSARINTLAAEGKIPKEGKGFRLADAVGAYCGRMRGGGGDRDGVTLEQARIRKDLATAEKTEIEVETLKRERLLASEVQAAFSESFGPMRAIIDSSAMSQKEKNDCLDSLREVPVKLGWEKRGGNSPRIS